MKETFEKAAPSSGSSVDERIQQTLTIVRGRVFVRDSGNFIFGPLSQALIGLIRPFFAVQSRGE